jgi:hypothetical protein
MAYAFVCLQVDMFHGDVSWVFFFGALGRECDGMGFFPGFSGVANTTGGIEF